MKLTFQAFLAISLAAMSAGFSSLALGAAGSSFVGEWKLDPSRSKLIDQFKVERVADDKYRFDFQSGGGAETIVIDGSDQPGVFATTLAIAAEGPRAWKVVRKKDGRTVLTANWKLSEDSNTLADDFSNISPDGTASTVHYVYQRAGTGTGLAGTWVSTSAKVDFVVVIQIRPYEGDGLSIVNSASLTRNLKLDGVDYPNAGPNAGVLATSAVRRLDARTLELVDKGSDGKVFDTQTIQLSPDLKTLTVSVLMVERTQPNVFVYERQ